MWFLTDSLIVSNMKRFAAILLLVVITCGIQASEPVKSEAAQLNHYYWGLLYLIIYKNI
jgi:TRAP-type C4-dicarboxylate transport system permease large subunit